MRRKYHPRALVEFVCEVCTRKFTATQVTARYCGQACQQEAYRERKHKRKAVAGDGIEPVAGDGSEASKQSN